MQIGKKLIIIIIMHNPHNPNVEGLHVKTVQYRICKVLEKINV